MPQTASPAPKTQIRTYPEDPETVGIDIAGREFLLSRHDAVELALKILTACGVQLLDTAAAPPAKGE